MMIFATMQRSSVCSLSTCSLWVERRAVTSFRFSFTQQPQSGSYHIVYPHDVWWTRKWINILIQQYWSSCLSPEISSEQCVFVDNSVLIFHFLVIPHRGECWTQSRREILSCSAAVTKTLISKLWWHIWLNGIQDTKLHVSATLSTMIRRERK